jgi:tRNA-binding protein
METNTISWADFEKVELRVGTIGIKKSSAQITHHYTCEELIGKQIVGVTNFAPKQISDFMSEFLVTGFADENGHIVLNQPQMQVPNGSKLV